jgi:hypothetical protein
MSETQQRTVTGDAMGAAVVFSIGRYTVRESHKALFSRREEASDGSCHLHF